MGQFEVEKQRRHLSIPSPSPPLPSPGDLWLGVRDAPHTGVLLSVRLFPQVTGLTHVLLFIRSFLHRLFPPGIPTVFVILWIVCRIYFEDTGQVASKGPGGGGSFSGWGGLQPFLRHNPKTALLSGLPLPGPSLPPPRSQRCSL